MDRVIIYPGALPQTTDQLNANKFGMVGQAYQNRALLGTATVVAGLACTPTSPTADLHVTVGVGSLYQMDPIDAAAYGDLGVDNNSIMKQAILAAPAVLTITPPGTAGFSQVFLVQAILNDVDAGQTVLSYYNSVPPNAPFAGPANAGTSNFTTRTCPCVIALKAGVAATTGTQATPAPDAGYVGLYAVTVANGQTQITSPNIVQQPTAPFFPTLPSVPAAVLNGSWVYQTDTGAANAYVVTYAAGQFIPTAYVTGMEIRFKALVTNTGASTINVNGLGAVAIFRASGVALAANDILSGQIVTLSYDGVRFQMVNYLGAAATSNTTTAISVPYVADSGAQNAIVATFSPVITAGQQIAGLFISVKIANNITGACTINVNGLGLKNVLLGDLANPLYNVFVTGEVLLLVYDGTQYQVVNTSSATYRKPTANTSIFVNGAIGSDANDGVSNTAGHALATIGGGIKLAFSYAPSQFTITVVVEPGTYNEAIVYPTYAGPNVIIDGLVTASVVINAGANHCFNVSGPNTLTVKNLTFQNSGAANLNGFFANSGATIYNINTASNTIGGGVFAGFQGGNIFLGNHTFSGSCAYCFYAADGGSITFQAGTFTFSTSISVIATAQTWALGVVGVNVLFATPIFVNPSFVSGLKYHSQYNGIMNFYTLGFNILPGNSAGLQDNGGLYIP